MTRVQLWEVADIVGGGRHKLSGKQFVEAGGFPAYGAGGLNGFLDHREFCKSAVVLSSVGARCGKCFLTEPEWTSLANTQVIFPDLEKVDLKFLWYQLDDEGRWPRSGAAQPFIKPSDVKAHAILLPPLDEQRRIVAVLDKVFAGIATATANAQKNLINARALFEGFLHSVLTERSEGWAEFSFDRLCSISSKLVDPRLPAYFDLPHVGAGNMESRTGGIVNVITAREEGLKSGKFLFDPSMVLYSKIRPYLMKACRPDFSGLCSADVYPLAPNADLLDRDMLFHILMSEEFTAYAEAGSARAGMPKVNREHLFKFSVWLPEIERQRAISEKLDSLSEKCLEMARAFQSKLVAMTELKQTLLRRAFAGEVTSSDE